MQEKQLRLVIIQKTNGEEDVTTLVTEGKVVQKETAWYVHYKEVLGDSGEVSNIVKIDDQSLQVIRQGALQMKQVFQKGKSTEGLYKSPYGNMHMRTKTFEWRLTKEKDQAPSHLYVGYQLWLNEQYIGEFNWELTISD